LPRPARTKRRMEHITGRTDDRMNVRAVNEDPTPLEQQLLKQRALAPHKQVELTKDAPLDLLKINVEHSPHTEPDADSID
ncbi:phenylacetate--CoA ligase, partial [Burkholderia pseudomallei]